MNFVDAIIAIEVYCCVGALKLAGRLDSIDRDKTAQWLAMRQCSSGGLNGENN